MIQKRSWLITGTAFLVIEILLIAFVDRPLSEAVRDLDISHHSLIDFFRDITDIGKSKWYLWVLGFGGILCAVLVRLKALHPKARAGYKRIGEQLLFLFASVAASGLLTDMIKPIPGRGRPIELVRDGLYTFHPFSFQAVWNSMPSGHSTTVFTLAFALTALYPRGRFIWFAFALLLAASRIMVNAHFLSDVIAGTAVAYVTVRALRHELGKNGMFHVKQCIFPIDTPGP